MSSSLKNKVIVITRSGDQAYESAKKLESLGAKVIPFPTIKIVPVKVFNHFDTYTENLSNFDYIVFTSENAVKYSIERLQERNLGIPDDVKIVCVGEKTASKCDEYKIKVDIIPDDFTAKGLLKYFESHDILEKKFFIPSSEIARKELKEDLIAKGADVVQIPIYDVALPDKDETEKNLELIKSNKPDLFIFTSPSTFKNYLTICKIDNAKNYFSDFDVAAIGPTTADAIKDKGVSVDVVPDTFTMDGLIDSILDFYSNKKSIAT